MSGRSTPAPPTDIHDLDPQQFLEEVHSFDFWFEAVEGYLSGLTHGHKPDTPEAVLGDVERDQISDTLRQIRLDTLADRPAGLLSHGQKQWLEIGMLLVQEPKLLLLDEPVAGMTDDETMRTAELFVSLAGKHSLVVVEHDMAFVKALGGKVTVLHEGAVLAEGDLDAVQNAQRLIEVYLGR